jgi:hypothetical protein
MSATKPKTVEEFEAQYAARSGITVKELRDLGLYGLPCDCGEDGCDGFQMRSPQPYGKTITAKFMPKRLDDVRPELVPLIGEKATWRYAGTGRHGEPYPGQHRWDTRDERFQGHWAPDEDLEAEQ